MTAEQFVYWLQGAFEVGGLTSLGYTETQVVKDHLALVLKKETPTRVVGPVTSTPAPLPAPVTPGLQPWKIPPIGDGPLMVTC